LTTSQAPLHNIAVCWIGNPRYTRPLNPTDDKKWALLQGLGIRMCVIAFAAGLRPRCFSQHAHFYLLPELPVSILRYAEMFLIAPLLLWWLIVTEKVTVIVAQSPYEGACGAWVKVIAGWFGKPVRLVVESHGDFEVTLFQQRRITFAALYRWLMNAAARYALSHADALRAISSATRAQLQHWSPGKPIEQFITWTDARVFRETPRPAPLSETRVIVYAGVLTPLKGVHFLIEAFARLQAEFPAARLRLVGKPEDQTYAARCREQVRRLGLSDRVQFVGAVQQTELAQQMASARVLVLPSTSEGLGRVLIEAMLCGTPVIASRVGGVPDVVEDGVNGYLIPPGDVEALVDRLRRVLSDPDIEAMGEGARAFAENFFSETAYVEGYRRLLEAALHPSPLTPQNEGR
jgi:glycosyltransferase involved in cell wall biosynthesis